MSFYDLYAGDYKYSIISNTIMDGDGWYLVTTRGGIHRYEKLNLDWIIDR